MKRIMIGAAGVLCAAAGALGQVHDTDIVLRVRAGRMQTGAEIDSALVFPHGVYNAAFGEGGIDDFTNEPGYDSDPETSGLTPGASVGFNFLSALRVWNGQDFSTVASPRIRASFGPLSATSPATDGPAPGLAVSVGPTGAYHNHFGYTLVSTAEPPAVPAEAGVYALKLEAVSSGGIAPSLPYWLIFDQNASPADVDAATAWLTARLACIADVASLGGTPGADGLLTADDVVVFLAGFFAGDLAVADVASLGGAPGPDGALTADDVVVFLTGFFAGCE